MLFYPTTLQLARFFNEDRPEVSKNEANFQAVAAIEAWINFDFLCKNYILNRLDNMLYNVYSSIKTTKELLVSLDKKYKIEDASIKKFVIGRYLDYKMVDSKSFVSQVQELQAILHEIHAEGMILSESFQVASIIWKLSPLWKDFKNYLKYKRKEMNPEDLIVWLRIEKDNMNADKKRTHAFQFTAKNNMVEHAKRHNNKTKKMKQPDKGHNFAPKNGENKKARFDEKCFISDKLGHRAADYYSKK